MLVRIMQFNPDQRNYSFLILIRFFKENNPQLETHFKMKPGWGPVLESWAYSGWPLPKYCPGWGTWTRLHRWLQNSLPSYIWKHTMPCGYKHLSSNHKVKLIFYCLCMRSWHLQEDLCLLSYVPLCLTLNMCCRKKISKYTSTKCEVRHYKIVWSCIRHQTLETILAMNDERVLRTKAFGSFIGAKSQENCNSLSNSYWFSMDFNLFN